MSSNQPDPMEIRIQGILRETHEPVSKSNRFRARVASLMNPLEEKALLESSSNGGAHVSFDAERANGYSFLNWAVDSALQITNATKANLQTFDPASGVLQIVAHRGFKQPFLDFFRYVHGETTACGKAFATRERVIVEDVIHSPVFHGTPALEVLLDAGVRGVQSTPLLSPSGAILGMLSTHWPSPCRVSNQALIQLDALACTVARWLTGCGKN